MTDSKFRPVRLVAMASAAAAVLVLSGCSGDAGGEESTPGASEASASPSASSAETAGGGSGSPSASPSSSATGSYEPATSEGPAKNVPVPEMPDVAKEESEEGLEATIEYWWDAEFYLKATGDAAPMESISSEDCVLCTELSENWPSVYAAGGWVVSDEVSGEVLDIRREETGSSALFTAEVSEEPSFLYKPGGELVEDGSAPEPSEAFWSGSASFQDGAWTITGMGLVENSQ